ncbi:thiolase family protein [Natroniella sulfidigena]|uniref:thiolase family protein n=1 Tax=Natroniella sulfidigena TaxID=723921 RepID=UPI00200A2376|nr:thiolase family protein [Natroniella sulfidigena]MCK8816168.1 thiolase family protein [Natroniella sulfidigena]
MEEVYILGGLRTPIGKTGGNLKELLPEKMAAFILNQALEKYNLEAEVIDEVILGNAVGLGGNIARLSLLEAGWPLEIPGTTIDFQCGSALSAINLGANLIKAQQKDFVIVGGVESTSLEPKRQFHEADPRFRRADHFLERAIFSPPSLGDPDMGQGAENVAELKKISRRAMDRWALKSHQRANSAQQQDILKDIIAPLEVNGELIDSDESIRPQISSKLLSRMRPVFREDGKVTAGNSCLTHDGAAVIILASQEAIESYNLSPQAKFITGVTVGVDPNLSPLGATAAIKKLLTKQDLTSNSIDAVEINEAFAVKILAALQELEINEEQINILGGALAYGHPYGASGAIILLHLIQTLQKIDGKLGIAALGVAGGQGIASLIERCDQ